MERAEDSEHTDDGQRAGNPRRAPYLELAVPLAEPGSGIAADRPDLHPDPDDLVAAVGAGMQALHGTAVERFPVDEAGAPVPSGWPVIAERCRAAVAAGLVDPGRLPEPYRRYTAAELLDLLLDGRPDSGDQPELVVCHGRPTLDRLLVHNGRFVGFTDSANALLSDRHLDLAIVHQSVQQVFGPEAVFRFYASYGRDPNVATLEHYVLVSHLLGAGSGAEPAGRAGTAGSADADGG
ncbi:MAG: phosphotransferase [Actinomycetota bacterium]